MNFSTSYNGEGANWLPAFIAVALIALWVLLHIALALGVTSDIQRLRAGGRETQLLGSSGWWFFTILSGPVGFAYYWVMHHSSLRDPQSDVRTPTTRAG